MSLVKSKSLTPIFHFTQAGVEEKIALTTKFIQCKKEEYEILQAELEMMHSLENK